MKYKKQADEAKKELLEEKMAAIKLAIKEKMRQIEKKRVELEDLEIQLTDLIENGEIKDLGSVIKVDNTSHTHTALSIRTV